MAETQRETLTRLLEQEKRQLATHEFTIRSLREDIESDPDHPAIRRLRIKLDEFEQRRVLTASAVEALTDVLDHLEAD